MDLFDELFNNIWNDMSGWSYAKPVRDERRCPLCGRTMADIKADGKFGCSECYKTFRNEAQSTLRQIHTVSAHKGKIPGKSGEELKRKRRYEELKAKLQEAVRAENYEEAAKLHKEIRSMEANQ